VLLTDQKFCCITQKLNKKVSGRILKHFCCLYFSFLNPLKKVDFSQIWHCYSWKNVYHFDKMRKQCYFYTGDEFFSRRLNFSLVRPDYLEWSWKHWFCGAESVITHYTIYLHRNGSSRITEMSWKWSDWLSPLIPCSRKTSSWILSILNKSLKCSPIFRRRKYCTVLRTSAELEFLNSPWGAKNRVGTGLSYLPAGYRSWRNSFLGIYSWAQ
jgi:hypothetical protein